jgi:acyl transferase domain-containing protein
VLDTACSSSLYALHTACRALQSGDCDAAIVAGANLIQSPHQFIGTEKAGVLSKTSTCHTFDTSADGYGRADGVGALYVKRLSDALRDGDPIRSVIRATAVNSNGRTNGITQPSADGQEAVIRKAYAMTDLDPSITDYIETHGTGTSLGDATEVDGVARVFSQNREKPLLIGSVKTNLGHSEAASGISSIIKVTMAMEKGVIPPTVGVTNINPKLKLDERNCEIVRKMTPWPTTGRARIASINSFGYGGANAHMILEEAASYITPKVAVVEKEQKNTVILPLSANTPQSLDSLAQGLADINPDVDPISLASTLFNQRSRLSKRGYVVAKTTDFSESVREAPLKTLPSTSKLPLAFVFTGQGAQWSGMGRSLLTEYPSFRQSIRRLDAVLQSLPLTERPDWLLEDVLGPDANEDEIHNPSRSQPICTAVQVAIIRLLADWNIKPSAVIGHSSGEIASAYCTGHLTAEQAIIVAYYRGFVAAQTPNDGMMLAGGMNEEQATDFINDNGAQGKVRVACVNSPENVTLSGDADAIDELAALLTKQGIMARKLKTHGKAYHSHHMARVGPKYEELLQSLASSVQFNGTSNVRMVSTVTGKEAVSQLPLTYWRQNLEQPVLFNDGIEKLFAKENYHLVEIGPHSALALPLKQILSKVKGAKYNYDSALIRGKDAAETLLQLAGNLYLHGHNVNIDRANGISSLKRESAVVDLAPYPWHYDTVLWNEPRASIEFRNQKHPRHELLGSKVPGGNGVVHTWRNIIRLKEVGWLAGHKLDQSTVFPAAGYLATAIEAIRQVTDSSLDKRPSFVLKDVRIEKALALLDENPESGVELMTTLQPHRSGSGPTTSWEFNMTSFAAGIPLQHAFGSIAVDATDRNCNRKLIADADVRMEEKPAAPWYAKFAEGGLVFGDQFQSLTDIHVPTNKAILQAGAKTALIQGGLRANSQEPLYAVHPATIDAMLQAGIIANTGGIVKDLSAKVPVNIAEIHIQTPVAGINATGKISATSEKLPFGAINVAADLFADDGSLLAQVRGCRAAAYRSVSANVEDYTRHPMLRVQWKPDFTEIRSKHSSAVSRYLIPAAKGEEQSCGADKLMSLLGLALHQNPKARILELGQDSEEITKSLVNDLATDEIFAPCAFFSQGQVSDDGKLSFRNVSADPESYNAEFQESTEDDLFDIVLLSGAELDVSAIMEQLSPAGQLMGKFSTSQLEELSKLGFEQVLAESREAGDFVVLKQIQDGVEGLATAEHIVIVENSEASESESFFAESLASKLRDISKADIQKIALKDLSAAQIPEKAAVISTLEFERTLLAVMSEEEMNGVRILTETASSFIWLTSGSLLKAPTPEFGLAAGIARSVMLERPSLKFITYDIDTLNYNTNDTIENIFSVLAKAVSGTLRDFEFLESDGLAHISRFVPDAPLNKVFRERQNMQLAEAPIGELGYAQVPMTDLIRGGEVFFRQEDDSVKLPEDWVKVDIKALELDTSVIDQGTTFGFTGVIVETGSKVGSFLPGDYVFALAPSKIATSVSVPQACCYRVKKSDNLSVSLENVFRRCAG